MVYRYDIVLDGQLGERWGTLSWTEMGGAVRGTFSLLGVDNPVRGRLEGERLELFHALKTAVSTLECRTCAQLCGDELSGTVISGRSRMGFHGSRAASE